MKVALDENVARLATRSSLATLVTLMPDGQPQALPVWVDTDGDHILINTEPQRQKARNISRDSRVTVLIQAADNPTMDWAEIRGRVVETVGGEAARAHVDAVSRKYVGTDYEWMPVGPQGRIMLKIAPTKVNTPTSLGW